MVGQLFWTPFVHLNEVGWEAEIFKPKGAQAALPRDSASQWSGVGSGPPCFQKLPGDFHMQPGREP